MSIEAMKQALEAKQTPLIELLERVPADARMVYEHDQFHSQNIPVGRLCHEAAAALRAAIEQYDQTSLELCEKCGWKAIIPGDGCLVCARQKAQPVAWMYDFMADNRDEVIRDWMTQDYADIKRENGFNVRPLYAAPPAIMQKPVAYADSRIHGWPDCFVMEPDPPHTVPLYTAPREWVELTDDEARALVNRATFGDRTNWQALVYMVDAKLKEKNAA